LINQIRAQGNQMQSVPESDSSALVFHFSNHNKFSLNIFKQKLFPHSKHKNHLRLRLKKKTEENVFFQADYLEGLALQKNEISCREKNETKQQ
jgi:hypothetical protein